MARYTTINSNRRSPWAQVQRIITDPVPPIPTPPPPVVPYYLISGSITSDGSNLGFSVGIEFTTLGTIFTATSGSYGLLVAEGYGGTATPHSALGTFAPTLRTYGSVTMDTPFQDYAYYPYPSPVITGEVTLDGSPVAGVSVSFSGDGQDTTDAFGTYSGTMVYGYTGVATVLGYASPAYSVTPTSRSYTNLTASVNGQDFAIETQLFDIFGFISSDGTFGAYEVNANGTSWFSDAVTGSYGYLVLGGFDGSTVPSWISDPASYSYTNVSTEQADQDFDIPVPFLTYAPIALDWSTWAFTLPDFWVVQSQNPVSFTWSQYDITGGATQTLDVNDYGTNYRVYGVDTSVIQITPFSNAVEATPPDPGNFNISGAITTWQGIPMAGIGVEFGMAGTAISDVNGTYSQTVFGGFTGTAIPHYSGGTFAPQVRVYVNVLADTPGQDYVFTGTTITLSGSVFDGDTGEGVPSNLWVDSYGTISTT